MERCDRCGTDDNVMDGLCGSCADDLRGEQQAQEDEDYHRHMAEEYDSSRY